MDYLNCIITGRIEKYRGITKIIQERSFKHYYPGLSKCFKQWVTIIEVCIKTNKSTTESRPKVMRNTEHALGPEDILQNQHTSNYTKLRRLPEHRFNDRCVFVLLFCVPNSECTSKTVGRCIIDLITRHAYIPTLVLLDKGSQFRSELWKK